MLIYKPPAVLRMACSQSRIIPQILIHQATETVVNIRSLVVNDKSQTVSEVVSETNESQNQLKSAGVKIVIASVSLCRFVTMVLFGGPFLLWSVSRILSYTPEDDKISHNPREPTANQIIYGQIKRLFF